MTFEEWWNKKVPDINRALKCDHDYIKPFFENAYIWGKTVDEKENNTTKQDMDKNILLKSDPDILEPDRFELEVAATNGIISRCPFCGRWPIITMRFNKLTGIYGARIICEAFSCGVTLHVNASNRIDARSIAIERWSKRF